MFAFSIRRSRWSETRVVCRVCERECGSISWFSNPFFDSQHNDTKHRTTKTRNFCLFFPPLIVVVDFATTFHQARTRKNPNERFFPLDFMLEYLIKVEPKYRTLSNVRRAVLAHVESWASAFAATTDEKNREEKKKTQQASEQSAAKENELNDDELSINIQKICFQSFLRSELSTDIFDSCSLLSSEMFAMHAMYGGATLDSPPACWNLIQPIFEPHSLLSRKNNREAKI